MRNIWSFIVLVMMPNELAFQLHQLHVGFVQFACDSRVCVIREAGKLLREIDFVERHKFPRLELRNQLFGFAELRERRTEISLHCAFAENALSCWAKGLAPFRDQDLISDSPFWPSSPSASIFSLKRLPARDGASIAGADFSAPSP